MFTHRFGLALLNFKIISTKCFMMLTGTFREISERQRREFKNFHINQIHVICISDSL